MNCLNKINEFHKCCLLSVIFIDSSIQNKSISIIYFVNKFIFEDMEFEEKTVFIYLLIKYSNFVFNHNMYIKLKVFKPIVCTSEKCMTVLKTVHLWQICANRRYK